MFFLLPGRKREKNEAVIGNWTEQFLKTIHVDVCLLGTSGIYQSNGPTSHSYQEIGTKQLMIEQSDLSYVLCDSSKFKEQTLRTLQLILLGSRNCYLKEIMILYLEEKICKRWHNMV